MIDTASFIRAAEEIAATGPEYRKGGNGRDGTCDCIGLIIGAIQRCGGQWKGLHGSNYAAREEMRYLRKLVGTGDLRVGEVVYKTYRPGETNYSLPERYKKGDGADLNDYYHIGIVESVYPIRIRHMSTPGARMDTSIGKWSYHGMLKKIQGGEEEKEGDKRKMKVIIEGGVKTAPIHMRSSAGRTKDNIITDIPQGSEAELIEGGGEWNYIAWNGIKGYVMSKFVKQEGGGGEADPGETVTVSKAELEKIYDLIGGFLGLRG